MYGKQCDQIKFMCKFSSPGENIEGFVRPRSRSVARVRERHVSNSVPRPRRRSARRAYTRGCRGARLAISITVHLQHCQSRHVHHNQRGHRCHLKKVDCGIFSAQKANGTMRSPRAVPNVLCGCPSSCSRTVASCCGAITRPIFNLRPATQSCTPEPAARSSPREHLPFPHRGRHVDGPTNVEQRAVCSRRRVHGASSPARGAEK